MSSKVNLSPPWYSVWNKVNSTIGIDPSVTIGQLQTGSMPYIIPISTDDPVKGQALANILIPTVVLGNIVVSLQVSVNGTILTPKTPKDSMELAAMVKAALNGNPLLTTVVVQPMFPQGPVIVWVVLTKSVVQFFNDDLSDLYNNFNGVTASVFKDILNPAPGGLYLYTSTTEED